MLTHVAVYRVHNIVRNTPVADPGGDNSIEMCGRKGVPLGPEEKKHFKKIKKKQQKDIPPSSLKKNAFKIEIL